ncbi:MAG TPA: sigma-70 family RNA polymerase sigma factor [Bacteroidota bacterium]|jgi:RNA polymerase sigma-70 factor (ECF subfamily)|nr:sigma-70 family RNA polymerase sigma factor [Bacteroidota bacterium]
MNEEQDLKLVDDSLHGDQKAFGKIVDKYQRPIFNVALRILNNVNEAQDIAQEVFIKAYNNLPNFNHKYKLFSWLYRIAINESLNLQQSRRRGEALNEGMISGDGTPEDILNNNESSEMINIAIGRLNQDYQTVIILKHLQGFSYNQIGEILGIPEKTVKSRLFTARQQLKDILIKQL